MLNKKKVHTKQIHRKQIRKTIELSSQDETKCLKTQKTKDTFVSTGTYINPLNNTIVVEKDLTLLSHEIGRAHV